MSTMVVVSLLGALSAPASAATDQISGGSYFGTTECGPPPPGYEDFNDYPPLVMTGDLDTSGSLRIDGKLEGSIRRADTVVLGVGATMTGDVHAREVVIGGSITGNIHATERVELQATAIVTGDVLTQTILVQEGGVVNGRVLMRPPEGVGGVATLQVSDGASSSR